METPQSLLQRLRKPDDHKAWTQFVELYTPLLYRWSRTVGLQEADAADLIQETLLLVFHKLPGFRRQADGSFRGWLRTVAINKWRDLRRRRGELTAGGSSAYLEIEVPDSLREFEETEYRSHLAAQALRLMKADFQPATWKACWELVVNDRPAAAVGAELGISEGAVYAAKFRVIVRLRQELEGLLD